MHELVDEHMEQSILSQNAATAAHNREHFDQAGTFAINMMSAPGAGKTTLLSETIPALPNGVRAAVIEGDMVGEADAERLRAKGIVAYQISTGRSCHLDARMVARKLHDIDLVNHAEMLFIENVGNLVCPAEFPLGEHKRVVLLSVTEGDDKPLKYPVIFRNCDAVVFTKCDLLPYVNFNLTQAARSVRDLNDDVRIFAVSTQSGQGMTEWLDWLSEAVATHIAERASVSLRHLHQSREVLDELLPPTKS